uniref:Putative LRR receptor-like serine/threonine-protein kinase At1g63430 n=2 Tax=Anthurium amnicola TaxID=1678845 RepID=A0A1D1Z8C6_9ARAE
MRSVGFPLLLIPSVLWGVFFLPTSHSLIDDEVLALLEIKKAIFEDPHSVLADWNANDKDPCGWSGVFCSAARDHVLALNLSHSSLKGFLAPELGSLTSLQELTFNDNLLLGTIPYQIGLLKSLQVLDLSTNRLSGPIPPEIGGLDSISKVNFHSNGLTGTVPPELGNLSNLVDLRLERNRLQGFIPGSNSLNFTSNMHGMFASHKNATGFCLSRQLKIADFSYNFFIGEVPPCLKYLPRTSFQGNCLQDKESILQRSPQQCGGAQPAKYYGTTNATRRPMKDGFKTQKPQQPKWLLILEICTGAVVVVFIITAICTATRRLRPKSLAIIPWKRSVKSRDQIVMSIDDEMLKHVLRLSRQELEIACEDFSNIIGSSPDSIVYKGTMKGGPEIAVISFSTSEDDWTSYHELYFQTEVADLTRLNHENTAKFLGYCKENDPFSRMLVFEYASNGTLYEHLHYGEGCQLSWTRRMKIAIGIARGLRYLHNELQPPFTLSELNSSAVYLTEEFSPKLVDFENWKMVLSGSEMNSGYIINGGGFHCFPDSLDRRHTNVHGNTFAFGLILLEIVSGRPPYCKERGSLVDWARDLLDRTDMMCHLVDPELRYFKHDDLRVICNVVSLCIQSEPSKRPSMQVLCTMLENGIDTSATADLKESPLAWAELALSS